MKKYLFTSESVTEGHPDKVCDQIADAILDELLKQDPYSRCACEVTSEPGAVHIMGEITTKAQVDYQECARSVIRKIGYTNPDYGFTDQCKITCSLHKQSDDIALGVDHAFDNQQELGAGDQGIIFGYACNETDNYMPLAISLAHKLTYSLSELRKNKLLPYLRPDGKSQVTVEYHDGIPARVEAIVISAQHDPEVSMKQMRQDIRSRLIDVVIPKDLIDKDTKIYINPTGRFVIGGPAADTGLTGRKIIADTYGGYARHGGGAFSGKDPTKVDRSAAYMARYAAKHIVAAGLANQCEIQLGYVIGIAHPVSVRVDTFGTGKVSEEKLTHLIQTYFDLRPSAIIQKLNLRRPIYLDTATYGHFGRNSFPWEQIDSSIFQQLKTY